MEKELPEGWGKSSLEHCTIILDNLRKPVNAKERSNKQGDIPYYGATGQAGWIDDYIFDEELVLLGEDGAPFFDKAKNVAFKVSGKSWVNNHAHVLKAKENITLNEFLLHYLNYFDYANYVGGTTRLKLTQGDLKQIPFPLPPLAEQKRIVAKLDMAFGYLETLKASLARIPELLKTFRQSVLTQAVTGKLTSGYLYKSMDTYKEWRLIEGNDIFDFVTSGSRGWADYYADSGKLFLRMTNLNYDTIEIDASIAKNRYVNLPNKIEGLRTKVQPNDILISITAEVGMIGIIPEGFEEAYVNQHIALARPNKRFYPKYLAYFLASKGGGQEQFNNAKKGATKSGLGLDDIRNLKINTPSLDEQFLIVERIECLLAKADAIEAQYLSLKEKIDKLPQALLAKAFRGELVPQDPADEPAAVLLEKIQKEIGKLGKKGKKQMELAFED